MNIITAKNLILKNLKKFLPVFIFTAGLLIGGAVIYFQKEKIDNLLAPERAGEKAEKAMAFINQVLQQEQNVTASLMNISQESGVYKIHLKIEENEYDSYISKDGKLLFSSAFNLGEKTEENQ